MCGLELGAGLYETLVVMPAWTHSLPDSLITYVNRNIAAPEFALNAGGRLWMVLTPLTGLTALVALLSGLRTGPTHRRWRIIGTGLAIIVVGATFAWFVPNIMLLLGENVLKMPPAEVAALANRWVTLNWIRVVVYSSAWLCALQAFATPDHD